MAAQLDVPLEARRAVLDSRPDVRLPDGRRLIADDLYVVWSVKVLGNWKALVSTDAVPGYYWEVTFNGAKEETYVDLYRKARNTVLRGL